MEKLHSRHGKITFQTQANYILRHKLITIRTQKQITLWENYIPVTGKLHSRQGKITFQTWEN